MLTLSLCALTPSTATEPRTEHLVDEEIFVTAQKRQDRLDQIPLAVTVLSREELEASSLDTSSEVAQRVPGLEIKSIHRASNPTLFLRGVGLNDFNSTANGAVSLYVDEVYVGAPSGQVLQLFDLERVEVLRGPQGTLFGRNTTGGAILMVTRPPGRELGGRSRLGAGRFDHYEAEAALDLPWGDRGLGARLVFSKRVRDGYTENLLGGPDRNDVDATAGRIALVSTPTDSLSIRAKVSTSKSRAGSTAFQSRGLLDGADLLGYVDSPDPFSGSYDLEPKEDVDTFGTSIYLALLRSGLSITSVTAFSESERLLAIDDDASPNRVVEFFGDDAAEQFSQELRLSSTAFDDRLVWVAGAYYLEERLDAANAIDAFRELREAGRGFDPSRGIFFLEQAYDQEAESFALFGRGDLRLGPSWSLALGLRQSWESKHLNFFTAFVEPDFSVPLIDETKSHSSDALSGMVSLSYAPRDNWLFFGSVRRGFKSGGFNGGALFSPDELTAVEPELLTSLELGLKASWLERRLSLGVTAFSYDYRDLQVFNFVNTGGVPSEFLDNAAKASIEGLEVEIRARPTKGLELRFDASFLDARYDRFVRRDGVDYSDNRLISAPEWSFSAAASYTWQLGAGILTAHADVNARDDVFLSSANAPLLVSESRTVSNARLAFEPDGRRFGVALWSKNVANEIYVTEIFDFSDFYFQSLVYGEPRTYGIDVTLRF